MKRHYYDYTVEWDVTKNWANYHKHGVRFEYAARVFMDYNRIEYYDEGHSGEEDRFYVIGLVEELLFVVYTERGDCIRIISARYATKEEEAQYYGNC